MLILGFNCYVLDSAACVVRDGTLVAAAQQERFSREKGTGAFPQDAIAYCLSEAGASMRDVDHVAFYWEPFHGVHRRVLQIASTLPRSLSYWSSHSGMWWSMVRAQTDLRRRMGAHGARFRFHRVRHHIAHAASAFLVSPYERAAILTMDGAGEITSTALGLGEGSDIHLLQEVPFPHSMGYVYCSLTDYLGFTADRDEYKVMALASYGGPSNFAQRFKDVIALGADGTYRVNLRYFNYPAGPRDPWVSERFIETFGPRRRPGEPIEERHQAIAWALQRRLEEVGLGAARALYRRTGARHMVVAGGCGLNPVMNERLSRDGPFEDVWVPPAPNDAGTCLGAAYWVDAHILGGGRRYVFRSPYLGPSFDARSCATALAAEGLRLRSLEPDALVARTVDALVAGEVVGWFQGRMELGPRALGARSILADPRSAAMRDHVNEKVKHREWFRPLAPAVLEDRAGEFFEPDRLLPYMLFAVSVRPEKRSTIAAVTHVDGTARVQTVSRDDNPLFYALIKGFAQRTGVPVLLNTSFNDAGEPIVCTPHDALRTFRAIAMDALALGPYFVPRSELGV